MSEKMQYKVQKKCAKDGKKCIGKLCNVRIYILILLELEMEECPLIII